MTTNLLANNGPDLGSEGLSLLDIGPLYEKVPVSDKLLRVFGISAKGLFSIFQRYPAVGKWFSGGKFTVPDLVAEAPDAMAAIIAAGCALPGNAEAEERASTFPIEAQLDVLEAIARLTFKNGFGPFVMRIVALNEQAASLNYGRVQATASPPVSKPVLPPDLTPSSPGASPPVS